jgi:CRP/FNR family transcriptional regulator, cyclic AMP receptor protein
MMLGRDELLTTLRSVTIFAGLSEEHLAALISDCQQLDFAPGDLLIEQGTPASDIYIIIKGRVSIFLNKGGKVVNVTEFGPGDCVGEVSVIGILNHTASVKALEPTAVLVFAKKLLMDFFHTDARLFSLVILNIARELARRLHHTNEILLEFSDKSKPAQK